MDTAQWYLWKRELQHSVDQAALSAAWAMSNEDSADNYEERAMQEFTVNQNVTRDFTSTPQIALADFAGGDDNSVVVTATATKALPFSNFLTGSTVSVRVQAQARFAAGGDYRACLVALGEDDDVISIGGNANVRAQCGLAALSCEDDAINIDGSAQVLTDSIATCGTANVPSDNESVVHERVTGLTDPYADLVPPDNPTARNYRCVTAGRGASRTTLASLQPGTYGSLVVSCTTVLAPGIYVIDGGLLDLAANYNVTGSNVMFVLKNGAYIKLGGNGSGNSINLTPMTAADFAGTAYADDAERYAGILVFEHRNNTLSGGRTHTLNGNSNSVIEGLVYLPANEIRILGTADVTAQCLQVSAYRISVSGNAFLETLCPTDETMELGGSEATVRLVS